MRLIIEPDYEQLSKWAANYVAAKICSGPSYRIISAGYVQEPD